MITSKIKELRILLGYTQTELAYLSKVSLPSIQNIEANKANPSLDTMQKILKVLGFNINVDLIKADWDELAFLGLPISSNVKVQCRLNADKLLENIRLACLELMYKKTEQDSERKKEALESLLLAIKLHYPSLFKSSISHSELLLKFTPTDITGRHIKLKRIALANISKYL